MPLRFRKTVKVGPVVKMNLSKGGVSFTIGKKGYHINIGKRGVRQTVGIPGTGISYTTTPGKDDDDKEEKGGKDSENPLGELGGVAGMAAMAAVMSKHDDNEDEEDEKETKSSGRKSATKDSDEPVRIKRKSTRKAKSSRKGSSPLGSFFILLSAIVFFVAGAAVLGLIPGGFVSNVGHLMVQWAMQFGH